MKKALSISLVCLLALLLLAGGLQPTALAQFGEGAAPESSPQESFPAPSPEETGEPGRFGGEDLHPSQSPESPEAAPAEERSPEVVRVEEAIRNLPAVTLESKAELDRIKYLYDSLPEGRKKEVANYDELLRAYDFWYGLIYQEAERAFESGDFVSAEDYYRQLPEDYENVQDHLAVTLDKLKLGDIRKQLLKTWTWDGEAATADSGRQYAADFKRITFALGNYSSIYDDIIAVKAETRPTAYSPYPGLLSGYDGLLRELETMSFSNLDTAEKGWIVPLKLEERDTLIVARERQYLITNPWLYVLRMEAHLCDDGRLCLVTSLDRIAYFDGQTKETVTLRFYYTAD